MIPRYDPLHPWAVAIAAIGFSAGIGSAAGLWIGIPAGLVCAWLYHIGARPDGPGE